MNNITFARNLVKGKIAETVFAQMLRQTGKFTVLEFGYEKMIPDMIQSGIKKGDGNEMIETLRTAPDFAVINRESREVHLIEVKYLKKLNPEYVLEYAKKMSKSWNPSYLFVITMDGFYFGNIDTIIKHKGEIAPLDHPQISRKIQEEYLNIIRDFERGR